jgi:hypothetical protein
MTKLFGLAALCVIAASLTSPISAAKADIFTVDAINEIPAWLDTGINLNAGTIYNFDVINPGTIWSAGSDVPFSRESTANGIDPSFYGQFTFGDLTANFGTLVGEVGSHYFVIGTGPVSLSGLSGELKVGYWDSVYGDNSGSQTLEITTAIPETSTVMMMLLGFAGVGFVAYRRSSNGPAFRLA